jgi:hypothetical protein
MKYRNLGARGLKHVFVFMVLVFGITGIYPPAVSHADPKQNGVDISSPQCGRIGSLPHYNYGIVGLNGTYALFGTNPCVREEAHHFDQFGLYVGTNYPSRHCSSSLTAKQCGGKAANFDIDLAKSLRLDYTKWWIDVEINSGIQWSTPAQNSEFIKGLFYTLKNTGKPVGLYSTREQWQTITGGLNLPANSTWLATGIHGQPTERQINYYCDKGFAGVSNVLIQYINRNNIDVDVPC